METKHGLIGIFHFAVSLLETTQYATTLIAVCQNTTFAIVKNTVFKKTI